MNLGKFLLFTTEEIIQDKDFINWILHPDKESDRAWAAFLDEHEQIKYKVREAAFVVRSFQPVEPEIPDSRIEMVLSRIKAEQAASKRKRLFSAMKYAAGILLIVSAGIVYFALKQHDHSFPVIASDSESLLKGRIILADGSTHEFDTKQTIIQQTSTGTVMLNNDTIENGSEGSKGDAIRMNQIIIPYGKRSGITLADGSHIWLNSGSQLSYPSEFRKNSREVYLTGEAFFDVKTDAAKPFYVITKDIRIRVMGTRFNVTSYAEDNFSQTVLLRGKVRIAQKSIFAKSLELEPGERFTLDKSKNTVVTDNVDVRMFSSWVDGFLIFENEPTTEIFKKLERYYNQRIIADQALDGITFSGKLDLKDDIRDVLNNIAFASSLHVTRNDTYFIIKP
jgi:transmembrane sensor